jgi:microcystin-dependent protein
MSNRNINYTNLGGFPLTQYTLHYMQSAYNEALTGLAKLAGNNIILTGVENTNGVITDGWIVWNGELLPFQGGLLQSTFIVSQTTEDRKFADDVTRTVYTTRFARFGSGGAAFSSLTRLSTILKQQTDIQAINQKIADLDAALRPSIVPKGTIVMWGGSTPPAGWALCDGVNGRPDLRGRFIVGAGQATGLKAGDLNPVYNVGDKGGENMHKLTIPEMPSHSHNSPYPTPEKFSGSKFNAANATNSESRATSSAGGDQPHENRPPYYVLAYIIKV